MITYNNYNKIIKNKYQRKILYTYKKTNAAFWQPIWTFRSKYLYSIGLSLRVSNEIENNHDQKLRTNKCWLVLENMNNKLAQYLKNRSQNEQDRHKLKNGHKSRKLTNWWVSAKRKATHTHSTPDDSSPWWIQFGSKNLQQLAEIEMKHLNSIPLSWTACNSKSVEWISRNCDLRKTQYMCINVTNGIIWCCHFRSKCADCQSC